jgi:uncharacterized protein YggT (Ycf19 family)
MQKYVMHTYDMLLNNITFATVSSYITLCRAMRIYHLIDTFATSQYRSFMEFDHVTNRYLYPVRYIIPRMLTHIYRSRTSL